MLLVRGIGLRDHDDDDDDTGEREVVMGRRRLTEKVFASKFPVLLHYAEFDVWSVKYVPDDRMGELEPARKCFLSSINSRRCDLATSNETGKSAASWAKVSCILLVRSSGWGFFSL